MRREGEGIPFVVWGGGRELQGCLRLGEIPIRLHRGVDWLSMTIDGLGKDREKYVACSFTLVTS